jgi:hypothetical protein
MCSIKKNNNRVREIESYVGRDQWMQRKKKRNIWELKEQEIFAPKYRIPKLQCFNTTVLFFSLSSHVILMSPYYRRKKKSRVKKEKKKKITKM